ncbi:hypothetical protein RBSH_02852 [Rhodopirellula baltica SH28]|nr:hypothetical protein RBSH_02852 [Rhodopirellula baltica SH28]
MTSNQITSTWLAALIPWFLLSSWVSSTYEKWSPTRTENEPSSGLKLSEP